MLMLPVIVGCLLATPQGSASTQSTDLVELVRKHDHRSLEAALSHGADPNGKPGHPPLQQAALLGDLKAVQILLSHKADAKAETKLGPILGSAVFSDNPTIVRAVIQAGGLSNRGAKGSCPPICLTRSAAVLREFIHAGADLEAQCDDGQRVLHAACSAANEPMVSMLLAQNVRPDPRDSYGNTPLIYVGHPAGWPDAEGVRIKIARALISHGADPEAKGHSGTTAYDEAKSNHLLKLAAFLKQAHGLSGSKRPGR